MATIQKRVGKKGTSWTVVIRLKGAPKQVKTFSRLTDARVWATTTEAKIREGAAYGFSAKKKTVAEAIDRYVADVLSTKKRETQKCKRCILKLCKDRIGHMLLSDVTNATIVELRDFLIREPGRNGITRKISTVRSYLIRLNHVFVVAVEDWEWIKSNPIKKKTFFGCETGRVRYLSEEERNALLEA